MLPGVLFLIYGLEESRSRRETLSAKPGCRPHARRVRSSPVPVTTSAHARCSNEAKKRRFCRHSAPGSPVAVTCLRPFPGSIRRRPIKAPPWGQRQPAGQFLAASLLRCCSRGKFGAGEQRQARPAGSWLCTACNHPKIRQKAALCGSSYQPYGKHLGPGG